jgi:hypothetical protein
VAWSLLVRSLTDISDADVSMLAGNHRCPDLGHYEFDSVIGGTGDLGKMLAKLAQDWINTVEYHMMRLTSICAMQLETHEWPTQLCHRVHLKTNW